MLQAVSHLDGLDQIVRCRKSNFLGVVVEDPQCGRGRHKMKIVFPHGRVRLLVTQRGPVNWSLPILRGLTPPLHGLAGWDQDTERPAYHPITMWRFLVDCVLRLIAASGKIPNALDARIAVSDSAVTFTPNVSTYRAADD
jgi:hypothetical protein